MSEVKSSHISKVLELELKPHDLLILVYFRSDENSALTVGAHLLVYLITIILSLVAGSCA